MKYVPLGDTVSELLYKKFQALEARRELESWHFESYYEGGILEFYRYEGNHYAIWGSLTNEDAYMVFIGVDHEHACTLEFS